MRRTLAILSAVLGSVLLSWAMLGAGSAGAAGSGAGAAGGAGVPGAPGALQANQTVARRDARALLAELRLPPGTRRSPGEPAGDGHQLLHPQWSRSLNTVGVSSWWTSPEPPAEVLDYVDAHRPRVRGDYQLMTAPGTNESTLAFIWTIDGAHLLSQQLQVTVARLADGRTGLIARAQSTWMVPRPANELVPDGVRSIAVTLRIGGGSFGTRHMRSTTHLIHRAWRVAALVRALDSLPIVQPGAMIACPLMLSNGPTLSLRFLGAEGRVLARALVSVHPGRNGWSGSNSCDPIEFWVGSRHETPLTSRTFVSPSAG